jgi:hypothetical protein
VRFEPGPLFRDGWQDNSGFLGAVNLQEGGSGGVVTDECCTPVGFWSQSDVAAGWRRGALVHGSG